MTRPRRLRHPDVRRRARTAVPAAPRAARAGHPRPAVPLGRGGRREAGRADGPPRRRTRRRRGDALAAPPFGAEIHDPGAVWGRGTLDDEGPLVAICEAVETLLGQGFTPRRTCGCPGGCNGGPAPRRHLAVEELERRGVRPWVRGRRGRRDRRGGLPRPCPPRRRHQLVTEKASPRSSCASTAGAATPRQRRPRDHASTGTRCPASVPISSSCCSAWRRTPRSPCAPSSLAPPPPPPHPGPHRGRPGARRDDMNLRRHHPVGVAGAQRHRQHRPGRRQHQPVGLGPQHVRRTIDLDQVQVTVVEENRPARSRRGTTRSTGHDHEVFPDAVPAP